MATSDAQKRANYKWARKNTHFFGVKMPNRDADALISACAAAGVTPHSVFLAAARDFISTHPGGGTPAAGLSPDTPGTDSSGADTAGQGSGAASADAVSVSASGDIPSAVLDALPERGAASDCPGMDSSGAALPRVRATRPGPMPSAFCLSLPGAGGL